VVVRSLSVCLSVCLSEGAVRVLLLLGLFVRSSSVQGACPSVGHLCVVPSAHPSLLKPPCVAFDMQIRKFGPFLTTINRMLISVMCPFALLQVACC
jgi:hypothetical protein